MKYSDINKMFTTEVNKYLAQGYYFNTSTMPGSQGELGKVDLTNGVEIICVVLDRFSEGWDKKGVELIVGRVREEEGVEPNAPKSSRTIWLKRLERVSAQRFYDVSGIGDTEPYFGTEADAEAVSKKRLYRYSLRPNRDRKDLTSAETIKIVVPFIYRKLAVKNVDKKRIAVFRTPDHSYIIEYRGKAYQLNNKEV